MEMRLCSWQARIPRPRFARHDVAENERAGCPEGTKERPRNGGDSGRHTDWTFASECRAIAARRGIRLSGQSGPCAGSGRRAPFGGIGQNLRGTPQRFATGSVQPCIAEETHSRNSSRHAVRELIRDRMISSWIGAGHISPSAFARVAKFYRQAASVYADCSVRPSSQCISSTWMSKARCIRCRLPSVFPAKTKVTFRHAEQYPLKIGSPLGATLNNNSGFSMSRFPTRAKHIDSGSSSADGVDGISISIPFGSDY